MGFRTVSEVPCDRVGIMYLYVLSRPFRYETGTVPVDTYCIFRGGAGRIRIHGWGREQKQCDDGQKGEYRGRNGRHPMPQYFGKHVRPSYLVAICARLFSMPARYHIRPTDYRRSYVDQGLKTSGMGGRTVSGCRCRNAMRRIKRTENIGKVFDPSEVVPIVILLFSRKA